MSERTKLAKQLREKGIPVPKDGKVTDMRHRQKHWISGNGWLVRLVRPSSRRPNSPATLLPDRETYWLPDSRMAHDIVKTQLVVILGRCSTPPKNTATIAVPKDYNDRWPVNGLGEEE